LRKDRVLSSLGRHGAYTKQCAAEGELPLQLVTSVQPASADIVVRFVQELPARFTEVLVLFWSLKQMPDEGISSIGQLLQLAGCCGNCFIRKTVCESPWQFLSNPSIAVIVIAPFLCLGCSCLPIRYGRPQLECDEFNSWISAQRCIQSTLCHATTDYRLACGQRRTKGSAPTDLAEPASGVQLCPNWTAPSHAAFGHQRFPCVETDSCIHALPPAGRHERRCDQDRRPVVSSLFC